MLIQKLYLKTDVIHGINLRSKLNRRIRAIKLLHFQDNFHIGLIYLHARVW